MRLRRPLLFCTLLAAFLTAPLSAREFSFKPAAWNDLSQALNISPYYLTLKDDAKARALSLEIELYRDGKLVKTLSSTGLEQQKPASIALNSAIYFLPREGEVVRGYIVFEADMSFSKASFDFPAGLVPEKGGTCSAALLRPDDTLIIPGRTPLYAIVHTSPEQSRCSVGPTWQEALQANPGATVLVFFLKAE